MSVSVELNKFIASFSTMPKDELIAWICIALGCILLLVGILLL